MLDAFLTTMILIISHFLFFLAGMAIANHYNDKAALECKDALERQYLRLRARADADDPCKPYKSSIKVLPESFEKQLKSTGRATALLKRDSKQAEEVG